MTSSLLCRTVLLAATLLGAAACDRQPPPVSQATPPPATPAPPAAATTPDKQGFTFGDGFHKEEAGPAAILRWVRRDAALRLAAPSEGRYRMTFRPVTVFSTVENTIEVSVNGQPADSFSTRLFDLTQPVPAVIEVALRAGDNALRFHSRGPEIQLGENDDRMAAYGLVMPIGVERVP